MTVWQVTVLLEAEDPNKLTADGRLSLIPEAFASSLGNLKVGWFPITILFSLAMFGINCCCFF